MLPAEIEFSAASAAAPGESRVGKTIERKMQKERCRENFTTGGMS
jgi:hypothetical protein